MYRRVLLVVAVIVIIAGIVVELLPYRITYTEYKPDGNHKLELYYLDDNTEYYIHVGGTDIYFAMRLADFSPQLTQDTFDRMAGLNYLLHESDGEPLDAKDKVNKQPLRGDVYRVVKLALFDENGAETVYTTAQYRQDPGGRMAINWVWGVALSVIGVLLLALTLFIRR